MSGKYGLTETVYKVVCQPRFNEGFRKRDLPRSRADIRDVIDNSNDGLARLLAALRDIANADAETTPPTILLAVDQGEELFNEEGRARH